jgi:hypothetical protein
LGPPQRRAPVSFGVAPRRALVLDSKLSAGSIRFFLFADGWADLLQLEPDGGHGITTGPEMHTRGIPLFAAQSGYSNGALHLEKPDHRSRWTDAETPPAGPASGRRCAESTGRPPATCGRERAAARRADAEGAWAARAESSPIVCRSAIDHIAPSALALPLLISLTPPHRNNTRYPLSIRPLHAVL